MAVKILYLNHAAYIGGAEIALLNLLSGLKRDRYVPCVCSPPGALADAVRALRVDWHPVPHLDGLNRYTLGRYLWALPPLAAAVRRIQPDIVHANTNFATQYAGPLSRWLRIATVGHIRDIELLGRIGRRVVRQNTRLIAISDAVVHYLQHENIPERQIVKVYDGVDLKQYTPQSPSSRQKTGIVIGIIGQLGSRKGHHILLEAVREILLRFPALQVWIVGKEPEQSQEQYTERLQEYVRHHHLEKSVRFWGFQSDIPNILAQLDMLVVPSLQEPFGKIVIEGMAMQKPVVASHVGGIPEIMVTGETGLLVPAGDTSALRQAIESLLTHPHVRDKMGRAGRKRVIENFSLERNVRQTEQVYEIVMHKT